MREDKKVLLITASVFPQEKRFLELKDPKRRLRQYLSSLRFYIIHSNLSKIVFCDNSRCEFPRKSMLDLAKRYGKELEILQFNGSEGRIRSRGKGYGEGEIIEYALIHSQLLKEAEYFIKVTGRLKILNLDEIVENMDKTKTYINREVRNFRESKRQGKQMNTVLYGMPKRIYMKEFVDAYKEVWDNHKIYLEHVFYNRIVEKRLSVYNLPRFPVIEGISGTGGNRYQESIGWERHIYNFLCRMFLFNNDLLRNTITYVFDRLIRGVNYGPKSGVINYGLHFATGEKISQIKRS